MSRYNKAPRGSVTGVIFCIVLLAVVVVAIFVVRYYPIRHVEIINRYSEEYDLEPAFVFAVINAESRFNDRAVSSAGASGLMQIMEDTAYWIAPMAGLSDFSYEQIFDPEVNIRLGCFYLRMYIDRFGSMDNAISAYNAGGGRVEGWLADPEMSSDGETLDNIPFAETRSYVEKVNNNMRVYRLLLKILQQ